MAEEMAFENGRISNFEGLVTLTLDRVTLHTIVHHSLTSTYVPNFTEIVESFCGWTDKHLRPAVLDRLSKSRPNNNMITDLSSRAVVNRFVRF